MLDRIINGKSAMIMRHLVFIISLVASIDGAVYAQELPSESAAKEGYKEISNFQKIFAPLWTYAYPSRNFDALTVFVNDIDSSADRIYKMEFKTRFKDRMATFNERKYILMRSVSDYVKAVRNSDTAGVYAIFPQIQSAFESTSVILLPLPYPALERLIVKSKFLSDSLVSKGNISDLAKANDTLIFRIQALSTDSLPPRAQDKADLAVEEFSYFAKLSQKMKDALTAKDMEKYKLLATELSVRLVNFRYKFLL